jgi:ABC-type multidrug transport system fused ATPase/permease subunit
VDWTSVREGVGETCRAALMHEFVNNLPNGRDTVLGSNGGLARSDGPKQTPDC